LQRTNAPVAEKDNCAGAEIEIYGDADENRK
jgi:hypothetical protein